MSGYDTRQRAEQYIATALGRYAADHDVPAIAATLRDETGTWDMSQVETERFWQVVEEHMLPGQEGSAPGA